jgi:hypothetical protein
MIMFGWLKSKRVDVDADKMFADAIKEVHPDRFVDPLEATTWIQPIIVNINTLTGRGNEERFFAIDYDRVVDYMRLYDKRGLLPQVLDSARGDAVISALFLAATLEAHLSDTVLRPQAELLISYLNRHSNNEPEPMPNNK